MNEPVRTHEGKAEVDGRAARSSIRSLFDRPAPDGAAVVGVLPGEGIGPEVIDASLTVLRAVEGASSTRFEVRVGGKIGLEAEGECRRALSAEVIAFIQGIFDRGGAVLAGAGGGRFVYDARREFDLFCKVSPIVPSRRLGTTSRRGPSAGRIDILVVRENRAGVYQGEWDEAWRPVEGRVASHNFSYTESQVRRVVRAAARLASGRRGELTVVTKPHGVPTVSRLWSDCAREEARQAGVGLRELEVDYAAFLFVHEPRRFDVLVAANLFGDILSDLGGALLGSRGLCYGGSFTPGGDGIFQTNHGAAFDLAGTGRANPVGQVLGLAMLLREGLGLDREADLVAAAVDDVWARGYRTDDLFEDGCRPAGTREMGDLLADAVGRVAASGS